MRTALPIVVLSTSTRRLPEYFTPRRGPVEGRDHRRVDLEDTGISVPPALSAAPEAWCRGKRPSRRIRPAHTGHHGVLHSVVAVLRPGRLLGRQAASAGVDTSHTTGFSTGKWVGNTLVVTTPHPKMVI